MKNTTMQNKFRLILSALIVFASMSASAQKAGTGKVVTSTRLVSLFSGMEHELLAALQQNDKSTLQRLLATDFQVWTPNASAYPVPGATWVSQMTSGKTGAAQVQRMAVRSLTANYNVVSFVLSRSAGESFVVDVWQQGDDGWWKLTDRYISPAR